MRKRYYIFGVLLLSLALVWRADSQMNTSSPVPTQDQADGGTGLAIPSKGILVGFRDSSGNLQAPVFCDKSALATPAASGNTQLVALVAAKKIYICGGVIMAAGTVNVKLTEGTGTACGTGTADLTALYPLVANTGFLLPNGHPGLITLTAGDALCVNLSAAVSTAVTIAYAQF